MFENTQEPVDEASMLADVRALPLGELVATETSELDDILELVLRGLPPTSEGYAAFNSTP